MDDFKNINLKTSRKGAYTGLIIGLLGLVLIILRVNFIVGILFSIIPIALIFLYQLLKDPYRPLIGLYIANYFIMGIARYIPIPSIGLLADALLLFTLAALIIYSNMHRVDWTRAANGYTLATLIWLTYCFFQLANPMASFQSWATSIRFVAFYAFFIAVLVPIVFYRYKDLKTIVFLWSALTLLAVLKALIQKEIGFDYAESRWLFVDGGASTHIISTGIRYFSFYTDAANFGSGMGMAMVTFTIIGLNMEKIKWKIYFISVGILAGYGMMMSGTRSAMIIPFAGFIFYILFSRKWKVIISGSIVVILAFIFFNMTFIGQGNAEIRRMRSAFNYNNDPSYNLRKANQELLKEYMVGKPFGVGVGMGGGKAASNAPETFSTHIATDSWLVVLWVETGIVGLILYLAIFAYIQFKAAHIVFFKIKDKQLRFILGGFLAGIFGIMVSSYSNEVITQFPNGIIIFVCQAFTFMGLKFDKEISTRKLPDENSLNT